MSGITLAGHELEASTGYGLMGLTWRANPPSQEQAFAAMKEALKHGANCWNGGEIYGNSTRNSLHLLHEYFTKYPEDAERVVISIKGGTNKDTVIPNGSPENTRRSIQECIDVLGDKKKLDLWESARVDPKTPIEVTMRTAKEFIDAGKLGGISLSECSADTIRRAAKVVKISAVEVEFSLWSTEILDNGVAQACKELNIPIIAYSPLGRGFLTGQIKKFEDIPEDDFRRTVPRFQGENFTKNLELVKELEKIAAKKGCKPGQVGIAWVKAKSGKDGLPTLIPIPGATTPERIAENMVDVELSASDVKEIDDMLAGFTVEGDRYGGHVATLSFGDSVPLEE
ncbi:pyridoxal reductase [Acrodontium crateriforme]|uniref:Pyridoxal reductase n=1 Tax=Acrodontium crateriforme TaxID=150365 RepID=A0AAQ3M0E5_9PEZI|nr:pyridoxal reductase [Acrodontium crateriforme]